MVAINESKIRSTFTNCLIRLKLKKINMLLKKLIIDCVKKAKKL